MQLKADLLGKPVSALRVPEAACLGAAILAATAAGRFADPRKEALRLAKVERTYRPDAKRAKAYREKFDLYRQIYPAMKGLLNRM
jgi:xylulokinase